MDDSPIAAGTLLILAVGAETSVALPDKPRDADILVVGAGISGLSAALEAACGGATVMVIELSSVFGGHAVVSGGNVCIVGTPVQESQKISVCKTPGSPSCGIPKWIISGIMPSAYLTLAISRVVMGWHPSIPLPSG